MPKLKKIDLKKSFTGSGSSKSEHPDISTDSSYLVKIYDHFYAGKFSKQWYGWCFMNWGSSGISLDSIQEIWKIIE